MRGIIGFIMLCLALASCRSGLVQIDRGEYLKNEELTSNRIVVINPDLKSVVITSKVRRRYFNEEKIREKVFYRSAREMAARNKLQLEFMGPNELGKLPYKDLQELAGLKRNMVEANFSQNNSLNEGVMSYHTGTRVQEGVFVIPPRIFPEYSGLSQRFGTPYFAIMGLVEVDATKRQYGVEMDIDLGYSRNMLLYLAIANVETGELIYRELKQAPHLASRVNLNPLYYDTFLQLKKSLKK